MTAKQTRKTRWIVIKIAIVDWIAKTKEYKRAHGKSRIKTSKRW